jgi:hypothetical protein
MKGAKLIVAYPQPEGRCFTLPAYVANLAHVQPSPKTAA